VLRVLVFDGEEYVLVEVLPLLRLPLLLPEGVTLAGALLLSGVVE
jgi:hypothetical protein